MAVPSTFFDKVVADAAQTYGLVDGKDLVNENPPALRFSMILAYGQISAACNRSFHKEARTVCYYDVYGPVVLMFSPVDTGETIDVYADNVQLDPADEYVIEGGILYFGDTVDPYQCFDSAKFVKVISTAGVDSADQNEILYTAMMLQGSANYNRRDLLGFAEVTGERGSSRVPTDKGGLLEAVKELIQPLVYYGTGVICS